MSGMATGEHRGVSQWYIAGIFTFGIAFFIYTILTTATYNRTVGEGGGKTLSQWLYLLILIPFLGLVIYLILYLVINFQRFNGIRKATGEGISPFFVLLPFTGMVILEFVYNKPLYGAAPHMAVHA